MNGELMRDDGVTSAGDLAFLVCDLQNDFLHPNGAYGRGGAKAAHVSEVVPRARLAADAVRRAGGIVIGTMFTLVPGLDGEPLIAPHLKAMRPFLGKGDFHPGSWGQAMVDEIGPCAATVEKIAYSAFYQTRLEWLLRRLGIKRLAICGIMTNGGLASTLRDAAVRDYPITLLEDGCAAFDMTTHQATIKSLSSLAKVTSCADFAASLGQAVNRA
jgi:ureidoacrylate peracid hydrolase